MPTTAFFKHRSGEVFLDVPPEAVRAAIRDGSPLSATDAGLYLSGEPGFEVYGTGLRIIVFPQHLGGFIETTAANQTDAARSTTASGDAHARVRQRGVTDVF